MSVTYQTTLSPSVPIESLPQVFAYNGENQISTITIEYQGVTYVQTFTYSGNQIATISNFVAQ